MTSNSMTFGLPGRFVVPRGATWFGNGAAALVTALRRIDRWLLSRQEAQPRTAEEVLAWSSRIEPTDPGFAADLRAAAFRAMNTLGH